MPHPLAPICTASYLRPIPGDLRLYCIRLAGHDGGHMDRDRRSFTDEPPRCESTHISGLPPAIPCMLLNGHPDLHHDRHGRKWGSPARTAPTETSALAEAVAAAAPALSHVEWMAEADRLLADVNMHAHVACWLLLADLPDLALKQADLFEAAKVAADEFFATAGAAR